MHIKATYFDYATIERLVEMTRVHDRAVNLPLIGFIVGGTLAGVLWAGILWAVRALLS